IVQNEPSTSREKQVERSPPPMATVLYPSAEGLRIVSPLAHRVIPDSTAKIWAQLGLGDIQRFDLAQLQSGQLKLGTKLGDVHAVFPRADKSAITRMQKLEEEGRDAPAATEAGPVAATVSASQGTLATQAAASVSPAPTSDGKISIEDFAKVELRVGEVKVAEKVKGADKLLRLEVDLGTEMRQVVAGIAEAYAPESLVGRKVVIVANLAP